jgi:hypothetical protein
MGNKLIGVGIDSDFGFLNMRTRNIGADFSGLRLGAGLNWENFSSENRIIRRQRKGWL